MSRDLSGASYDHTGCDGCVARLDRGDDWNRRGVLIFVSAEIRKASDDARISRQIESSSCDVVARVDAEGIGLEAPIPGGGTRKQRIGREGHHRADWYRGST